jgi:hypothetical protein
MARSEGSFPAWSWHARLLGKGDERQQPVANAGGDLLGPTVVAVHGEHVEPKLRQPFGCLLVEVDFRVAATGYELEAVVRPTVTQALPDDFRVSLEDDRQVRPVSLRVQLPQKPGVNTVEALHDQR